MYPFRVFLSYAHDDRDLAEDVAEHLSRLGMINLWDKSIIPGNPFTDEIKKRIAISHLFIPLITQVSNSKPWVHQETGYAMGIGIPIIPVVIGAMPGQMIEQLQAITLVPDPAEVSEGRSKGGLAGELAAKLTERLVEGRFRKSRGSSPSFFTADHPEKRTELICEFAREVQEMIEVLPDCKGSVNEHMRLRHSGALSSFSLPDLPPDDPIWTGNGGIVANGSLYYELLWEERKVLEQYAREWGCDLLIDPLVRLKGDDLPATRVRLGILADFIRDMDDSHLRVVVRPIGETGNLIAVGDWFYAEAMAHNRKAGYRQTNFTWHAPTVLNRVRDFRTRFDRLVAEAEKTGKSSREVAVEQIEGLLESTGGL